MGNMLITRRRIVERSLPFNRRSPGNDTNFELLPSSLQYSIHPDRRSPNLIDDGCMKI